MNVYARTLANIEDFEKGNEMDRRVWIERRLYTVNALLKRHVMTLFQSQGSQVLERGQAITLHFKDCCWPLSSYRILLAVASTENSWRC